MSGMVRFSGWPASSGFGVETVRQWVNRADIDAGERTGVTSEGNARIRRLEQETGSCAGPMRFAVGVGFRRGGARPPTTVMVECIDQHRDPFGVEPICRELRIAPSMYYAAKTRPPSARAMRDES